jgi:hypothetical protein
MDMQLNILHGFKRDNLKILIVKPPWQNGVQQSAV